MAYYGVAGLGRFRGRRSYGRRSYSRPARTVYVNKTRVYKRGLRGMGGKSRSGGKGQMFKNFKNYLPIVFALFGIENWALALVAGYMSGSGAMLGLGFYLAAQAWGKGQLVAKATELPIGMNSLTPKRGRLAGLLEESGREDYPSTESEYLDLSGAGGSTYQVAG